jgi:hypothetical protein
LLLHRLVIILLVFKDLDSSLFNSILSMASIAPFLPIVYNVRCAFVYIGGCDSLITNSSHQPDIRGFLSRFVNSCGGQAYFSFLALYLS